MNTHSYKVNKYGLFKTHQKMFLGTFQLKIEQKTHGNGCAQSPSRYLCYLTQGDFLQTQSSVRDEDCFSLIIPTTWDLLCFPSLLQPPCPLTIWNQQRSSSLLEQERFQSNGSLCYPDEAQQTWYYVNSDGSSWASCPHIPQVQSEIVAAKTVPSLPVFPSSQSELNRELRVG